MADYSNTINLSEQIELPRAQLTQQPIPWFANDSGVFNRVENQPDSQYDLEGECPATMIDEVPQTWEMLGNVNFTLRIIE